MRKLVLLLAGSLPCFGAASLSVLGSTAQQIILQAKLGDVSSCTVTVTPLVPDVDPTVFANANNCFLRDSSIVTGSVVTIVLGSRRAQWDLAGQWRRSRSFAADTRYTITVTDGSGIPASIATATKTISAGITWSDPLPVDPERPGQYLLPDWISSTDQTETINDPQTGGVLRRLTLPQKQYVNLTSQAFQSVFALDGGWSGVCPGSTCKDNAISTTYTYPNAATYTGTGNGAPGYLFVRHNLFYWGSSSNMASWAYMAGSADWYKANVSASISRPGCTGGTGSDDCKMQVCLTIDSVSCWSVVKDQEITTTMSSYTLGDSSGNMNLSAWKPAYSDPLSRALASTPTATVAVAADGVTVTFVSGSSFREGVWTNGTWLRFTDGTHTVDCQLAGINQANGNQLTLASGTCLGNGGIVLPAASITMTGPTFGLLIRKKTNAADTLKIGATSFSSSISVDQAWPSSGAVQVCGQALVNGGVYCTPNQNQQLYWVQSDGTAKLIGPFRIPVNHTGPDQWSQGPAISSLNGFVQDDSGIIYGLITDANGKVVIVKVTINDPNHTAAPAYSNSSPGALGNNNGDTCTNIAYGLQCRLNGVTNGITWTVLTPGSLGQDLQAQLAAFTAGQPVVFDPTTFPGSSIILLGVQDGRLVGLARTVQDSPGWIWKLNLGDGNPANAGGTGPHIEAATTSWGNFPNRYCVIHGAQATRTTGGWLQSTFNPATTSAGGWRAQLSDTSIPTYDSFNPTIQITLAADMTALGSSFTKAPTTIAVGDYLLLTTSSSAANRITDENVQVIARNGNVLTVKRMAHQSALSGSVYAWGACGAWDPVSLGGNFLFTYWNTNSDPHGTNSTYNIQTDPGSFTASNTVVVPQNLPVTHGAYQSGILVLGGNYAYCAYGLTSCYYVFRGYPPSFFSNSIPDPKATTISQAGPFAGMAGSGSTPNVWQSHPGSVPSQVANSGRNTVPDAFPFVGGIQSGTWTNLGGSGRLWMMATTVGATPDDLSGNAVLNRKRQPTVLIGGRYAMLDISGPSSAIGDSASDAYKYCVVRIANECRPGSTVGQIYANLPALFYAGYTGGNATCGSSAVSMYDTSNYRNSLCVGNSTLGANAIVESAVDQNDPSGFGVRELTKGLSRWMIGDVFWNAQYLPDGSWAIFHAPWMSNNRTEVLMAKVPRFPVQDSGVRLTFVPFSVKVNMPAGFTKLLVEYGYLEYGSDLASKFYCTSRRENCVVSSSQFYPSGGLYEITDAPAARNCVSSCSVTIPAIPGRILYWRPVFQDGVQSVYGKVQIAGVL